VQIHFSKVFGHRLLGGGYRVAIWLRLSCVGTVFVFWLTSLPQVLEAEAIRIASYNLENYLLMNRGGSSAPAPKPEKEIKTLIGIIRAAGPDILGVCELGDRAMFTDFKRRLDAAGLGFKDAEYLEKSPGDRHLALFSRFPIVKRQSVPDVPYELGGTRQKMRRGMLDVTVKVRDDYRLRLIGAHLKSKRPVPEGEALVRRHEARLLRKRIEGILKGDRTTNLLVYGDLNDTKNEPSIQEIMGARGAPDHMWDIWLHDDRGERWTYYWKYADVYSRVDYMFVSRALKPEVVFDECYVARPRSWYEASDHCMIVATIDPEREK
jgi:endonuclease/exonuclease/phosphatase family metal-dependent hydrolase